jgi:hypothetical protein
MDFNNSNVIYLESSDFSGSELKYKGKCIILIQTNRCGFCTKAKPDYKLASEKYSNCKWFTIEMDTSDSNLDKLVRSLPGFSGYPHYVLFNNGKLVKTYDGNRKSDDLISFVKNN